MAEHGLSFRFDTRYLPHAIGLALAVLLLLLSVFFFVLDYYGLMAFFSFVAVVIAASMLTVLRPEILTREVKFIVCSTRPFSVIVAVQWPNIAVERRQKVIGERAEEHMEIYNRLATAVRAGLWNRYGNTKDVPSVKQVARVLEKIAQSESFDIGHKVRCKLLEIFEERIQDDWTGVIIAETEEQIAR